jgi:exonuclease SbcD
MGAVRILFLADTHLGFDLPQRPRIERRRRGHDFFANFERALDAALDHDVDLVVHGGDLFYRSRIPASLVHRAFEPLKQVADAGLPVYLVPGNHERSEIPYPLLAIHPQIHIFDRATTCLATVRGVTVALAGFPYCRSEVRQKFPELLQSTGWQDVHADVNLLCVHHCFEGATVGPANYTFRHASDVVRVCDIPTRFSAVLTGHVHRHQVLTKDLRGRRLATPVLYPGSVERTSFAEKDEAKGYVLLECEGDNTTGGSLKKWEFCHLPARPMMVVALTAAGMSRVALESRLKRAISEASADAVLQLRIHGQLTDGARAAVTAANLRAIAPSTMNVEVRLMDEMPSRR